MLRSKSFAIKLLFIAFLVLCARQLANISKCASTESSTNNIISGDYTISQGPNKISQFVKVLVSQSSKEEIYFAQNILRTLTYISRRDENFQKIWDITFNVDISRNSPVLGIDDQTIYFIATTGSLTVYGYNNNRSPSISLLGVQSSIVCNSDYCIMEITKDGSYLCFTAISTTSAPVLCIVNIGGPASTMKCYTQLSSGNVSNPNELCVISNSEIYISISITLDSMRSGVRMKIDFNLASITWIQKISDSKGLDSQNFGRCLYSSSKGIIISLIVFSPSQNLVLIFTNQTDGSLVSNPYKFSTSINQISGSEMINSKLYLVGNYLLTSYLIIFDSNNASTLSYTFQTVLVYSSSINSDLSRILFVGINGTNSYTADFFNKSHIISSSIIK